MLYTEAALCAALAKNHGLQKIDEISRNEQQTGNLKAEVVKGLEKRREAPQACLDFFEKNCHAIAPKNPSAMMAAFIQCCKATGLGATTCEIEDDKAFDLENVCEIQGDNMVQRNIIKKRFQSLAEESKHDETGTTEPASGNHLLHHQATS